MGLHQQRRMLDGPITAASAISELEGVYVHVCTSVHLCMHSCMHLCTCPCELK